jgi:phage terminase large subunit
LNKTEATKLENSGYNVLFAKKGKGSINEGIETIQKCNIVYTKQSINLQHEYENYSWRMYQGIQMDEPEQNNEDHLMDCCRMGVSWYVRTRNLSI